MDLAPIALFVYNRPWHTGQCLESLMKNDLAGESELFIYADGPKENINPEQLQRIKEVRQVIRAKKWCREVHIIEQDKNKGLANSVIDGVTEIVNRFGKIIVLEDDLVLSGGFLKYMNDALNLYRNEDRLMHVSAYMFPVKENLPETFFFNSASCWGWGTWARAWKYFNPDAGALWKKLNESRRMEEYTLSYTNDFDTILRDNVFRKNNSWASRWHTSVFLIKGLCLHPNKSLIRNIGHDDEGEHCKKGWWSAIYSQQEIAAKIKVTSIELVESELARKAMNFFYKRLGKPPIWVKTKEKLKLIFNK